jgi:hypothetical protein
MSQPSILDSYVKSAPNVQNALDIFKGEWASKLPSPFADLDAGSSELFNDARVTWLAEKIGGAVDRSVLELGPLEGGHTYMFEKLGASEIVAIEANTRAFLKCLIIKELFDLKRARFLCGDFVEYLRQEKATFQICFASGVLYHMQNPVELIALLAEHCSEHLFLWTHYYDASVILPSPPLAAKFNGSRQNDYKGFTHTLYRQEYQSALNFAGFCGGSAPTSCWMAKADIVRCLEYFGFEVVATEFDHPDHPNGPAIAFLAKRR